MKVHIPAAAVLGGLLLAAPAAAQDPTVPAATPTPTPTATPAPPPPAKGKLTLRPLGTLRDGPRRAVVAGRSWRVAGTVRPYVEGQTVRVQVFRDGRRIAQRRAVPLARSADGKAG